MKILQICNYFSPEHGGSAEAPYRLSIELAKRGHDITIFTTDYKISQEWLKSARDIHIKVFGFKTWLNIAGLQITPGLVCGSKNIKSFDLIHMHNFRTFQNILVRHYANKYHIPYILQAHGSLPRIMARIKYKQLYDIFWGNRILRDASKVLALSQVEATQLEDMRVAQERIEIISNGIDLDEFRNLPERGTFRKKWQIETQEKVILFLARIHKIKGIDLLVKAFSSIVNSAHKMRLVIVGPDGGYLHEVERMVKDFGIGEKVLFTGPLYGRDKLEAYVDADVYVLPSQYEIFGISVIEAMACGKPVIVTDQCGMADVIDGQAGLVVPFDEKKLTKALEDMLCNEKMRQEFSRKGKVLVDQRFSGIQVAEQAEIVYQDILNISHRLRGGFVS